MLVMSQKIILTHLKRSTEKLGTYVTEFIDFTSVVKHLSIDVRVRVYII